MTKRKSKPKVVMSLTLDVFEDGSTKTVSLLRVDDDFWSVRKAMVALRKELDEDIRIGPKNLPLQPKEQA